MHRCVLLKNTSSDGGLDEKVKEWSKGNVQDYNDWIQELYKEKIRDMDRLKKVVASSAWRDRKFTFTPVLQARLEDWAQHENIIPFEQRTKEYHAFFLVEVSCRSSVLCGNST